MKPAFLLGASLSALTLLSGAVFAQTTATRQPSTQTYAPPRAATAMGNGATGNGATGNGAAANLTGDITNYERTQNADALLLAYGQAVTDPVLARAAIAQLLTSYYNLRNQAQSAEQATQAVSEANLRFQVLQAAQNQVLIQQNQQILNQNSEIIQLLKQNARVR
jgi:hypothetical protein